MQTIILSNANLSITLLPTEGGRVSSLRSVESNAEFLTQSKRRGPYLQPSVDSLFQSGPCAGIEECLPTVGGCHVNGLPVPDHGDFWQLPWQTITTSKTQAQIRAMGFSTPLLFTKTYSVEDRALRVHYMVENKSQEPIPFLYACHPLLSISQGDRIVLPSSIREVLMSYSRHNRLGAAGRKITWPRTAHGVSLDLAEGESTGFAEMLYTDRLTDGRCGIYRTSEHQGLHISFSTEVLPFLGIWLCYGGWPEGDTQNLQYAVALEPTFAPVNTLAAAIEAGMGKFAMPGRPIVWEIVFEVTAPDISLTDFMALLP